MVVRSHLAVSRGFQPRERLEQPLCCVVYARMSLQSINFAGPHAIVKCAVYHILLQNPCQAMEMNYYPPMEKTDLTIHEKHQNLVDQIDYMLEKAWHINPDWFPDDHEWHDNPPVKQVFQ
jgi:hypothetical protein